MALAAALAACEVQNPQPAVWVPVPDAPIEAVAESLAAYDIVRSAPEFERFARMGRKHEGIKPGLYPLQQGMPMGRVLVVLRRGTPEVAPVTVRERTTIGEVALGVERALGVTAESFEVHAVLRAAGGRRPGRRAADDGHLRGTVAPRVERADSRPRHDAPSDRHPRLHHRGRDAPERNVDRAFVSSVYHNRLERGMRLQADPTVVYALGERRRLSFADLRVRSEYNTYLVEGLPPGPIGQPSVASIIAALYPPSTDYLYFVAQADGRHLFSHTYREHLGTIRELRTARRTVHDAPR